MEKIKLGVMFGGNSTEHEISIISAVQAMENLDTSKYEVIPIYITKDNNFYTSEKLLKMDLYKNINILKNECINVSFIKKENNFCLIKNKFPYNTIKKIDIVLPIMHGYNTEDGCYSGYLEVLGIPYAESDIYASVIAQDKVFQKAILLANGINVPKYCAFLETEYHENEKEIINKCEIIGFPLIIKPARQGSSVGITVAYNKEKLIEGINEAFKYDEKVLVEKVVENLKELNASVLGDNSNYEISEIEEVTKSKEILSYEDKYMSGGKKTPSKGMASAGRKIPADISKEVEKTIIDYSIKAARALNTSGVVRIDYLLDTKTKKVYLNEVNITPGSLSFYLWTGKNLSYQKMLDKLINIGIKKFQNKSKKLSSFETNVLESFNGSKGIKK